MDSKYFKIMNLAISTGEAVAREFGDGRRGGFYTIRKPNGLIVAQFQVGTPPDEDWEKFRDFSAEKGERLHANPIHVSSWQSRDPKAFKYGGACLHDDNSSSSFSGFPEKIDLLFGLGIGQVTRQITDGLAAAILEKSEGDHFVYGEMHKLIAGYTS